MQSLHWMSRNIHTAFTATVTTLFPACCVAPSTEADSRASRNRSVSPESAGSFSSPPVMMGLTSSRQSYSSENFGGVKRRRIGSKSLFQEDESSTPLMRACCSGDLEKVQELLRLESTDATATDLRGHTALMFACQHGYHDVVKALLRHCAAQLVDAVDKDYKTALVHAVAQGHTEVVETLLAYNAAVSSSQCYSSNNYREVNKHDGTTVHDEILAMLDAALRYWDGLQLAASLGHWRIATRLLTHGADVNATDIGGKTALMIAAQHGHQHIVWLLLDHGAAIDARCKRNTQTALVLACRNGDVEMAATLVANGATVDTADQAGCSALAHLSHLTENSRCSTAACLLDTSISPHPKL